VRRLVVATALAVGLMLASSGAAEACFTFCDWDPLVLVITPGGHVVPLYDSVWTSSVLDVGLPLETTTVKRVYDSAGNPHTAVDVAISVPAGLLFRFKVFDEVTTGLLGSGTVLASGWGTSGVPVHLKFVLHQP
jgi:hypothetical protein